MTSIARLKDRARKHEQREDWEAAIEAYQQVLQKEEGRDELDLELGLYNRIGDLYLRVGQTDQAVAYYEQAADKYAESGLYNNAIALCNKALRHRPNRAEVYLKLSRLSAEQGFTTDARRWMLDYAERQVQAGNVEAAIDALEEFAASSDDPGIRVLLAQQLAAHGRTDHALDHLRSAYAQLMQQGERTEARGVLDKARAIDPSVHFDDTEPLPMLGEPDDRPEEGTGLALEEGPAATGSADTAAPGAIEGLQTRTEHADPGRAAGIDRPEPTMGGLETFDREAGPEEEEPEPLPLLDSGYEEEEPGAGEAVPGEGVEGEGVEGGTVEEEGVEGEVIEDEELEYKVLEDDVVGDEVVGEEAAETEALEAEAVEAEAFEDEALEDEAVEVEAFEDEVVEDQAYVDEVVEDEPYADEVDEAEVVEAAAEGEAGEEEPEPLPLLDAGEPGVGPEASAPGVEEATEPVAEAPEEEAPEEEDFILADELPPMDLSLARPMESEPSKEGPADGLDLGDLDLSLGDSGLVAEDLDTEAVLQRAKELVSRGLLGGAMAELQLLSAVDAEPEVYRQALAVMTEIIRHDANDLEALQQRVEYATRIGDRELIVDAYIDLADALGRLGAETKAEAMYERVLDLDPENEVAREALGVPETEEGSVDLGAMLDELDPDQREAVLESTEPGDPGFSAMLSRLRSRPGEAESDGAEAGDHYDLGLAFREMGLIDEAIAEFQRALTGGEEQLKVYEELGRCFVLKGQYNVALKVFNRALQVPHADRSELLGVYYHMGQCHEELGHREEAKEAYEQVLSIDPSFGDVPDRVARL